MLNLKGRTGETRIALTAVVASLTILILLGPWNACSGDRPPWVFWLAGFAFTFGVIWLLILFFEDRGAARAVATVYAFAANAGIGFAGWGLSDLLLDRTSPDRWILVESSVWIPFWVYGALYGTEIWNACGRG